MATNVKEVAILDVKDEDFRRLTHMQRAIKRLRKDYLTLIALTIIFLLVLMAVTAPITTQFLDIDPFSENLQKTYAQPDAENWLGTDDKGRDHLARLIYGAQISLSVAFIAAALSLTIGLSMGILTGYYGGIVDDIMIWFITTLNSIPQLFLLLMVTSLFRPGPIEFILILGLLGWTGTMRLVRGETLGLREREYVVAARAMGASDLRIMFQHIMPNLLSIVVVALAIRIGGLILTESALSYLGFGINPPVATWGNMLAESQVFWRRSSLLVLGPGVLISVTVLCLYIIGDGLRDALDPTAQD
ncbi:MAG: oligopeptide ABC transporter permease AppC [Phototrophicaceae bacterium]